MALSKCGECGKDVSDKAAACPTCGNPISAAVAAQPKPEMEPPPAEARPPEEVTRPASPGDEKEWRPQGFQLMGAALLLMGLLRGLGVPREAVEGICAFMALVSLVLAIVGGLLPKVAFRNLGRGPAVGFYLAALVVWAMMGMPDQRPSERADARPTPFPTAAQYSSMSTKAAERAPTGKPTDVPKPTSPVSDLSFATIRRNMERMTDAQWEDYKRGIIGKRVSWSGWVEDVKEKFFGGYSLLIDMDPPHDEFSVQDVTFDDISDSFAKRLDKDDRVSFSGTISMVAGIMGSCQVSLDDIGPPAK